MKIYLNPYNLSKSPNSVGYLRHYTFRDVHPTHAEITAKVSQRIRLTEDIKTKIQCVADSYQEFVKKSSDTINLTFSDSMKVHEFVKVSDSVAVLEENHQFFDAMMLIPPQQHLSIDVTHPDGKTVQEVVTTTLFERYYHFQKECEYKVYLPAVHHSQEACAFFFQ